VLSSVGRLALPTVASASYETRLYSTVTVGTWIPAASSRSAGIARLSLNSQVGYAIIVAQKRSLVPPTRASAPLFPTWLHSMQPMRPGMPEVQILLPHHLLLDPAASAGPQDAA